MCPVREVRPKTDPKTHDWTTKVGAMQSGIRAPVPSTSLLLFLRSQPCGAARRDVCSAGCARRYHPHPKPFSTSCARPAPTTLQASILGSFFGQKPAQKQHARGLSRKTDRGAGTGTSTSTFELVTNADAQSWIRDICVCQASQEKSP